MDLGPLLGEVGLWVLKCKLDYAKELKDVESKKKLMVMTDIVEKYCETGLDVLGNEKKYNFINKYGPKKCPDDHKLRADIEHLYSW